MENFDDDNHDGPRTTVSGKKNKKIFLEMVQKFWGNMGLLGNVTSLNEWLMEP
jgi:hypothetical protein